MPNSETTISTSTDPDTAEQPPVIVAGGTGSIDPSVVDHAGRLAQLEERFGQSASRIENLEVGQTQLNENVSGLNETVKTSFESLSQQLSGLASSATETVAETVQAVTEPVTEAVADAIPTIKEHPFFRPIFNRNKT